MTDQQQTPPIQQVQSPAAVPPIQQVQPPAAVPPIPQQVPQPAAIPQVPQVQQPAAQQTQQPNPYQSIIDQQYAQIAALMAQNNALNQQVTQMVQGGAQFNQYQQQQQTSQVGQNWAVQPVQQFPPVHGGNDGMPLSLAADVDVSLESLASEIGKKGENG